MNPKRIPLIGAGVAALLTLPFAYGQTAAGRFPAIDVRVPAPPVPFTAEARTYLVYELHVTNLSARPTRLKAIEVQDGAARMAEPLLRLEGTTLDTAMRRLGVPPSDPNKRVLTGGQSAIVFVWVTLKQGSIPASLTHRFSVDLGDEAMTVNGVDVPVSRRTPRVIGPPLRGDLWLAANGPDNNADHRRTVMALSGEGRIAQRFAIDWVRLYEDGRTSKGDPSENTNYRAYGADVLAVADAVVSETHDGIAENVPDPVARAVPMTPETLGGNFVLLDLGDGASAFYAHLQPGSLTVKKGDNVHEGQVLGRVGNTGNSTEPHLHFHVADRSSAFDAEGIPYALRSFDLEASSDQVTPAITQKGNSLRLNPAAVARWIGAAPQRRLAELPLINAIVRFHDR